MDNEIIFSKYDERYCYKYKEDENGNIVWVESDENWRKRTELRVKNESN